MTVNVSVPCTGSKIQRYICRRVWIIYTRPVFNATVERGPSKFQNVASFVLWKIKNKATMHWKNWTVRLAVSTQCESATDGRTDTWRKYNPRCALHSKQILLHRCWVGLCWRTAYSAPGPCRQSERPNLQVLINGCRGLRLPATGPISVRAGSLGTKSPHFDPQTLKPFCQLMHKVCRSRKRILKIS